MNIAGVDHEQATGRREVVSPSAAEVARAAVNQTELIFLVPVFGLGRSHRTAAAKLDDLDRGHSPNFNLACSNRRLH